MRGEYRMKKLFSLFMAIYICGCAESTASLSAAYFIYSVEDVTAEANYSVIPDMYVLIPDVIIGDLQIGRNTDAEYIFNILKEKKPDLYDKATTKFVYDKDGNVKEPLVFEIHTTDEKEFEIIMAELVYSINWDVTRKERKIRFVFKDDDLSKKYQNKLFGRKDVVFPVFELKPKNSNN